MSLESWKEEFYPYDATLVEQGDEALNHSILKWEGLKPGNIAKHGLKMNKQWLTESDEKKMSINGGCCSLCQAYDCDSCPLAEARGGYPCDEKDYQDYGEEDDMSDPWGVWQDRHSPYMMIYWLNKAKEFV